MLEIAVTGVLLVGCWLCWLWWTGPSRYYRRLLKDFEEDREAMGLAPRPRPRRASKGVWTTEQAGDAEVRVFTGSFD